MLKPIPACVTAGLLLSLATLAGCQAERAVQKPVEPDWSYRSGDTQLSNNDAWEQLLPETAMRFDVAEVASVEEPTR